MTRFPRRLARRIKAATAAGLVPLLVVTSLSACATLARRSSVLAGFQSPARPLSGEWSQVEAVRVGTSMRVQLHESEPLYRGSRTMHGRFHSATADTLTLTLDEWSSPTHTIAKSAVHTVHVRRPVGQRYAGWLSWLGTTLVLAVQDPGGWNTSFHLLVSTAIGGAASLPGFLAQRRQQIYESLPELSRFIAQVEIPLTDGAVVPRNRDVAVLVTHASRLGRWLDETIGLTVCLSSHPNRCTGQSAVFEEPFRARSSSVTATLGFSDETVPLDRPMSVYVHVVLTRGPSWRPSPDQAVPQLDDPDVLDVETVTRRITVVDQ